MAKIHQYTYLRKGHNLIACVGNVGDISGLQLIIAIFKIAISTVNLTT
jgi:hypothetical protein